MDDGQWTDEVLCVVDSALEESHSNRFWDNMDTVWEEGSIYTLVIISIGK